MATKKVARGMKKTAAIEDNGQAARALNATRLVDIGLWREQILQAFRATNGNAVQAAERLSIGHRTLLRIMDDEVLAVAIEKIRKRATQDRAEKRKIAARERRKKKVTEGSEATQ